MDSGARAAAPNNQVDSNPKGVIRYNGRNDLLENAVEKLVDDTEPLLVASSLENDGKDHALKVNIPDASVVVLEDRKEAWLETDAIGTLAKPSTLTSIFTFATELDTVAKAIPGFNSSLYDATNLTLQDLLATESVPSTTKASETSTPKIGFDAPSTDAAASHVIDIDSLTCDANRLVMEQARGVEKSFIVPSDIPVFGWHDYYQLGRKLAYLTLRLRRHISSRRVIVEELGATKNEKKPCERITTAQIATLARTGLASNTSTLELVVRQLPRRRRTTTTLSGSPRKRRRPRKHRLLSHYRRKGPNQPGKYPANKHGAALDQALPLSNSMKDGGKGQPHWPKLSKLSTSSKAKSLVVPKEDKTRIGYAGCAPIFQALRTNTTLVSLSLEHCGVDDPSMCALAAMLRQNMTLTKLDLSGNSIGPLGVKELCDALEDIPDSSLIDLNLSNNRITDLGMRDISHALRENETLVWLDVSWNQISSEALLTFLHFIRDNFVLRSLSIYGSDLDEDQYCPNIESKFGKDIAVALRLVNPNFSLLRVTSAIACIHIDKVKDSRWIDLSNRGLAEIDALVVAGLLPLNSKLLTLDLSNNPKIERWGVLEVLSSIKHCKTLKNIRLANTGLYEEVGEQIGELVASNQTLEIIVVHETEIQVQVVRGNPLADPPEELEFRVVSEHHFDRWILSKCLALNRVTQALNGLRLPDSSTRLLLSQGVGVPASESLCEINLSGRSLEAYEASFLGKKILHHLRLGRVALNSCRIDGHGGAALADGIRNHAILHTLEMENNNLGVHGGRAMAECIEFNESLTYLNLSWNKIGNDGAVGLQRALSRNRALTRLDLRGNNLSAIGIVAISRGLQGNACLQELYLRWNTVCPVGAEALALALVDNKCLKLLDIEHHTIGARGVRAFAAMLAVNSRLTHINMTGDEAITDGDAAIVGPDAAFELANVLAHKNKTLTAFEFGQNQIGKDGIVGFNDVLKFNRALQVLDLSMTQLDAKLSLRFFECLSMNKVLRKLNLAHNCIANEGMMACIRALERNTTLRELNVADNWITEEPLALLAAKLHVYSDEKRRTINGLQWLCLTDNSMTERTRAAFRSLPPSVVAVELEDEKHHMASF